MGDSFCGFLLRSDGTAARVRVAIRVPELQPGRVHRYIAAILTDIAMAAHVELVGIIYCVVGAPPPRLLLAAYANYLDRAAADDPFAAVPRPSCLNGIAELSSARHVPGTLDDLDAVLDLAGPGTAWSPPAARHGCWHLHFGSKSRYPEGSDFLLEMINQDPVTHIELRRQAGDSGSEQQLGQMSFSTTPFLSRRLNSVAPLVGARVLILLCLLNVHRRGSAPLSTAVHPQPPVPKVRSTANASGALLRWIVAGCARKALNRLRRQRREPKWRIGVRKSTPSLLDRQGIEQLREIRWLANPPGEYWADPFLHPSPRGIGLFFEKMICAKGRAVIAWGLLDEKGDVVDTQEVLREDWHLSYPQIIEHGGEAFMLPEAAESGRLTLYRSTDFPLRWERHSQLLDFPCVDSTLYQHGAAWWLLTSPVIAGQAPLCIAFRADSPAGPWRLHDRPVVSTRVEDARGAGNIFRHGKTLVRPSQDCGERYGGALVFNEILAIEDPPGEYRERYVARIDSHWMQGLVGVHTYNRLYDWEVVDGNFV